MAFPTPKAPDPSSTDTSVDAAAQSVLRGLARGKVLNAKLRRLLLDALVNESRRDRPTEAGATVSAESRSATEWIGAPSTERGAALAELLRLADALPQGLRPDGAPSLPEKVVAVDRALGEAGIPHAIGGALALAYYGEPRVTIDIDVNVFIAIDNWPEIERALKPLGVDVALDHRELAREKQARLLWDRNPVHLFFSFDALHEEMATATRSVPFAGTEIPIVAPEHLVVRKAMLDRPKDWLDIGAILVATEPLDLEQIEGWVRRLAGDDDPRVTKLHQLVDRLLS
jgi:hypothetical protein